MFHPPYIVAEVDAELQALISTPLFRTAFSAKDPQFGYHSELGFLEENVAEAASLVVCKRQGIVPDPVGYLSAREGGVYKVGVVLFAYFDRMPKQPEEPFAAFFKRVVAAMPLGNLEHEYQTIIGDRGPGKSLIKFSPARNASLPSVRRRKRQGVKDQNYQVKSSPCIVAQVRNMVKGTSASQGDRRHDASNTNYLISHANEVTR